MAVTVSRANNPQVEGARRVTVTNITFDSSYPTGGEPLTFSDLGLTSVEFAIATLKTAGTGSVTQVWYDIPNQKLLAFAAAAQIANTTDISAVTAQVVAYGR